MGTRSNQTKICVTTNGAPKLSGMQWMSILLGVPEDKVAVEVLRRINLDKQLKGQDKTA